MLALFVMLALKLLCGSLLCGSLLCASPFCTLLGGKHHGVVHCALTTTGFVITTNALLQGSSSNPRGMGAARELTADNTDEVTATASATLLPLYTNNVQHR